MPFAATRMKLETAILSELSQTEKDKYYMILYICGILKKWYKLTYLQNRKRVTDVENHLMVTGVWKDPWRRERLPVSVFWPGEFHGLCMGLQSQT